MKQKKLRKVQQVETALIKTDNIGTGMVDAMVQARNLRTTMLEQDGVKQQTLDYIFGKTDTNPLENITKTEYSRMDEYVKTADAVSNGIA